MIQRYPHDFGSLRMGMFPLALASHAWFPEASRRFYFQGHVPNICHLLLHKTVKTSAQQVKQLQVNLFLTGRYAHIAITCPFVMIIRYVTLPCTLHSMTFQYIPLHYLHYVTLIQMKTNKKNCHAYMPEPINVDTPTYRRDMYTFLYTIR